MAGETYTPPTYVAPTTVPYTGYNAGYPYNYNTAMLNSQVLAQDAQLRVEDARLRTDNSNLNAQVTSLETSNRAQAENITALNGQLSTA